MSNYDRVVSGGEHLLVSAEIMNGGTGDVIVEAYVPDGAEESPHGTFRAQVTADEAIKLGLLIRDQGWKAKQAAYEANRSGGTALGRRSRALEDARNRMKLIRTIAENLPPEQGREILEILADDERERAGQPA